MQRLRNACVASLLVWLQAMQVRVVDPGLLAVALETPEGRRYLTEHAFGPAQRARLAELRAAR